MKLRLRYAFPIALALGFLVWSTARQVRHQRADNVLRISHTQAPAVVAGFERIFRAYEAAHPGVKIEQIALPPRSYTAWLRTRLVGEVAPDIVELSGWMDDAADYARYYRDLTPDLLAPNPYNRGSDLEAVRWRDTYLTGIPEVPNYFQTLLAYHSVPSSFITYRLIYNEELLRKFGYTEAPRTAIELTEMSDAITRQAREKDLPVVAIATESENGRTLLEGIVRSSTQETLLRIDPYGNWWNWDDEVSAAFLLGRWSLRTPEVMRGIEAMGQLGRRLPPGFMQVSKGEGTFLFLQGKAVFLLAPSFEYTLFRDHCRFPLGIVRVPATLSRQDRLNAEGNVFPSVNLGIVKAGKNQELALDFLRFLGSREGNRLFTETALLLPAITGLTPRPEIAEFTPAISGRPPGLSIWLFGKADYFFINQRLHELIGPNGSAERFIGSLEAPYRENQISALRRRTTMTRDIGRRLDTVLGALDRLRAKGEDAATPQRNEDQILETQVIFDSRAAFFALVVDQAEDSSDAEPHFAPLPPRPTPLPPSP